MSIGQLVDESLRAPPSDRRLVLRNDRWKRAALGVISACFLCGGLVHLHDIVRGGWLPYRFAPDWINVFWSSLAAVDLIAVVLLWRWRVAGLLVALTIMMSDVAVNSYATYVLGIFPSFAPLQLQTLFFGYLLGATAFLWPATDALLIGSIRKSA